MTEHKCKRCGRILKSAESIKRGYGKTCYKIIELSEPEQPQINNEILEELLNRVRKLELDNNFLKHQVRHKTIIGKSKDSELEWDIPKEVKEVKNEFKIQFNMVVSELKIIFTEDFDYHDVLKPVNQIDEPVSPPTIIEVLA
ncbi:MAG: DUF6011 domain-containing protein [Candidatus Odinarchaeota archaeon]